VYRKIFYKDLQDVTSVYFDIENEEAIKAAKQAGLQVNTSGYSSWIEGDKGIFVSLIDSEEAKLDRQLALEKGMILFTNLATYYACLQAIAISDDTVRSIQQLTKKEVVKQ
jgi:carbamoyl-phosphate synthase large subunit